MLESSVNKTNIYSCKMPDSQLHLKSKTLHRKKTYTKMGDTTHIFFMGGTIGVDKNIYWEGGHCRYFVDRGTIRVGTQRNIERTPSKYPKVVCK